MPFITLTCPATSGRGAKPFHVRVESIVGVRIIGGTTAVLVDGRSIDVLESMTDVIGMIDAAEQPSVTLEMARLLRAVWAPDMDLHGALRIGAVAEFLERTPQQVKATYEQAFNLATKGA